MRSVADECISPIVIEAMREVGHEIIAIRTLAPASGDPHVLAVALQLAGPVITEDLDFGELVFRRKLATAGVILLRLPANTSDEKATILLRIIRDFSEQLAGAFLVVSANTVRIRRL